MVLKFEKDPHEIFFVEAVGNLGVVLNRWSFLRKHVGTNKFYKRVIFRHVDCKRDDKMLNNLEKFLDEAIGLRYKFKFDIMRTETISEKPDFGCKNELISETRTFFCSELVAKAFKILGIIENDITPCSKFFPCHFGVKGDKFLKLTCGTVL